MGRVLSLGAADDAIRKTLARSFQSGHINFLIGSGASLPAIPAAGQLEQQIVDLLDQGNDVEARQRLFTFLAGIQQPTNDVIADAANEANGQTLARYKDFIHALEVIISERRTTLLPKQATIFTTNYDLFIEKASLSFAGLRLNDGFSRVPSLDNRMEFSSRNFFNTTYNTGNLYSYRVEIPCVNLIKLHGSLSWRKDEDQVIFHVSARDIPLEPTEAQLTAFVESYAVVLPEASKFRTTLLDRTYYELLRFYANELDREQALLIVFGFSFGDEHIRDITKRALKNPTLRLVAFAFNEVDRNAFELLFSGNNNVDIIAPAEGANNDFAAFNQTLRQSLPRMGVGA